MDNEARFDLHTHHNRCGHAKGSIEDTIRSALNKNIHHIGISDHSPYFHLQSDHPEPGHRMAKSQFSGYIEEVLDLQDKYQGTIDVLFGVESDYFPEPHKFAPYKEAYQNIDFDYLIGSVHFVHDISIFDKTTWSSMDDVQLGLAIDEYYRCIAESAKSGMFQVLGHIDALKTYCPRFETTQSSILEKAIETIAECHVAIEVNTSGKNKECGAWYPREDILKLAFQHGVPITFGSDAHDPERVGDQFAQVAHRLREIGFTSWVYFKKKQMIEVPL